MKLNKMAGNKSKLRWCIPVPISLDIALEEAVQRDSHISKSEFIRDAVRRKLEEIGFKPRFFEKTCEV